VRILLDIASLYAWLAPRHFEQRRLCIASHHHLWLKVRGTHSTVYSSGFMQLS
jgi:hypothetical protein